MNRLILLAIFSFFVLLAEAQISIGSANFPQIGDTLYLAMDNLPMNIDVQSPGESKSWNFMALQAPFTQETIIEPASNGENSIFFSGADMLIDLGDAGESYYRIHNNQYELLGTYGNAAVDFGMDLALKYSTPIVQRRAPMNYLDENEFETNLSLPIAYDDIPFGLMDSLNLLITPDSLRLRLELQRFDEVDAWGLLTIPGGIYDVLREKRTLISDTRMDAKVPFFGWRDITDIVLASLDEIDELGTDTIVSYHFFSDESKEPIALVTTRGTEEAVASVQYKSSKLTTRVQSSNSKKPSIYAYPNPAIVNVRFEFTHLPPGNYDLVIYNILGREVLKKKYYINGNKIDKVNISRLKKGTYLYSLINHEGRTITTHRLIVVRP